MDWKRGLERAAKVQYQKLGYGIVGFLENVGVTACLHSSAECGSEGVKSKGERENWLALRRNNNPLEAHLPEYIGDRLAAWKCHLRCDVSRIASRGGGAHAHAEQCWTMSIDAGHGESKFGGRGGS